MGLLLVKWLTLLICPIIISINAIPSPGLRRVPKVYNALITSDQNLEPSRAYPVIQPVVHRTSVGYVPPFYYTQIGPGFVGPQLLPGPGQIPNGPLAPGTVLVSPQSSVTENPDVEEVEINEKNTDDGESSADNENSNNDEEKNNDGKNKERVPLTFYPNYQSLYYNPNFYGYNPYSNGGPGTYFFDYQPRGPLGALPPLPLPFSIAHPHPGGTRSVTSNGSTSSSRQREKKKEKKTIVESPVM